MKDLAATPAPGGFSPTIGAIAAELPALYNLREAMSSGETLQDQREDGLHGVRASERPKFHPFEFLKDGTHARAEALESTCFHLEPQSADEALSLLLLADSAFEAFAGGAYSDQGLHETEKALWRNVTRAHHALVRWLHRSGAVSPLLADHFNTADLTPLADRIAEALAAAGELEEWFRAKVGTAP
jgi:hypothetical protein